MTNAKFPFLLSVTCTTDCAPPDIVDVETVLEKGLEADKMHGRSTHVKNVLGEIDSGNIKVEDLGDSSAYDFLKGGTRRGGHVRIDATNRSISGEPLDEIEFSLLVGLRECTTRDLPQCSLEKVLARERKDNVGSLVAKGTTNISDVLVRS